MSRNIQITEQKDLQMSSLFLAMVERRRKIDEETKKTGD